MFVFRASASPLKDARLDQRPSYFHKQLGVKLIHN